MPESKATTWFKRIGNIMLIFSFTSLLWGVVGYLMEPRIEEFIMAVVKENKGSSTRGDLAEEMGVDKDDVCEELGEMYVNFHTAQENIEEFNQVWIPYLEDEKKFYHVGFFVKILNGELEMWYKDFDGKEYRAWHDIDGWFYQKQGYKIYK